MRFFTKPSSGRLNTLMACSLLTIGTVLFSACSKNTATPEDPNIANVTVINTSPTLATFNVYMDGNRINPAALPFGGAMPYFQLVGGDHSFKFTTASSTESIITKKFTFAQQKIYSLIVVDKADKLDLLLLEDAIVTPATDKARIRFINLSPDAPALDLVVKDATTVLIGDKAYKAASAFIDIEPKTYSFQIKDKATSAVKATIADTEIKAGRTYTIISRGLLNATGTDQVFSGQVLNTN